MKTKPHGFVVKGWQDWFGKSNRFPYLTVRIKPAIPSDDFEPTCLLHPDTCDKLREFLENVESGVGYARQQAADLLKLLPEVGE